MMYVSGKELMGENNKKYLKKRLKQRQYLSSILMTTMSESQITLKLLTKSMPVFILKEDAKVLN